jgi:hypothetical protein
MSFLCRFLNKKTKVNGHSKKFHEDISFAYAFMTQNIEPTFVNTALTSGESTNWCLAMKNEYNPK